MGKSRSESSVETTASPRQWWLLGGCLALILALSCAMIAGTVVFLLFGDQTAGTATEPVATTIAAEPTTPFSSPTAPATVTLEPLPLPEATASPPPSALPGVPAHIRQQPATGHEYANLDALLRADYPVHDLFDVAQRLGRSAPQARTVQRSPFQVGDRHRFLVDGGEVDATLIVVTDHTYFWVEDALELDEDLLRSAAETFEQTFYPKLVHLFGQEWQPGVDNDPHFSILHLAQDEGPGGELGYFYSGDEYPRALSSTSNEQELLYLHANALTPGSDLYYATLVHEFQHLVQWYLDGNEAIWLDEGLSQLAERYVGLDTVETIDYLQAPQTPLHRWRTDDTIYAHYAATYLFSVYFWEQLGDEAVRELARHPANGLAAVDSVLAGYRPELSLVEFLGNWSVANFVDNPAAGPDYHYEQLELGRASTGAGIKFAPVELAGTVPQMGVHYVDIALDGPATLSFAGDSLAPLLPVPPRSGMTFWFAPAAGNVNAHLAREFDLSGVEAATLTFWSWYDLRFDTDAVYVTVSVDGGATWQLLPLYNGRAGEYGPALTGRSADRPAAAKGGWVQESVALDSYAGQRVLIRFELLTYGASDAAGVALDDIRLDALGFHDDVEDGDAGWQAAGFVRAGQWLPQQWAIHYIRDGAAPEVVPLALDARNQGRWQLDLGPAGGTLVVAALTPYAEPDASYWLDVTR
ncbi:MAG: immune inhibitor A [Anaerolineae bacterium]|nr:immune inhibitor A [Anaerolineae bacterium]